MMGTELALFERMGGTYTEVDGIYYPNIVMDDDIAEGAAVFTGRYGDAWKTYMMKKHRPEHSDSTMEMWRIREQAKAVAEETVFADIVYHIR